MKKLYAVTIMIATLAMLVDTQAQESTETADPIGKASSSAEATGGRHLFILSGQSNMYHMPADVFKAVVAKAFGEENVSVAKHAKTGAAIRYWDKDFPWPEDAGIPQGRRKPGKKKKTREEFLAEFGNLYVKLLTAVTKQAEGKTYDTVTFVWMQGESDSNRDPKDYTKSFDRVVARLKNDLKIKSMNIVIGRLSDCGNDAEHWIKFREGQEKYAEEHPNCEWIDTDDLNDNVMKDRTTRNDLHYTKEGYKTLAKRFAAKAIKLIKTDEKQR